MLRLAVVCAVGLVGCGSVEQVALNLVADSSCTATHFEEISTLSIEAFAQNGECKLAHSCVFNIDASDEVDLELALQSAGDVLLEATADDIQTISVNGRPRNDCFPRSDNTNAPTVCGSANLSSTANGELEIVLQCGNDDCIESVELCQ